jgi:cell division protein FtsB
MFSYRYLSDIFANYRERAALEAKYNELLEEEKELNSEVIKLQDPEYVARFARDKYLYSRPGELIIRIAP